MSSQNTGYKRYAIVSEADLAEWVAMLAESHFGTNAALCRYRDYADSAAQDPSKWFLLDGWPEPPASIYSA